MMLAPKARQAIEQHACGCYPRESCGLIVSGEYIACHNIADDPLRDFVINPLDYAVAEDLGQVEAVVHSHPEKSPLPSIADVLACEAGRVHRWIIMTIHMRHGELTAGAWHEFGPPEDGTPLIGCEFAHGSTDCYGLVRRYYKAALQIDLPDFVRRHKWWADGQSNLYIDKYAEAGFHDVSDSQYLQVGDVLLMRIASKVPNHAAVYIGDDEILHHMWGQLSRREALPRYRSRVTHILRHKAIIPDGTH
ncbi:C40 family peptidase [Paraburkholderia caribensis]|uniref:C40 family peptidase n=1 Tax=Paraburkholderia caribensis TaxID=75105 RepID=UPI001CADD71B|nr:NlpC/P60 family protein [Paraburkholderia caribensis]CAG9262235.1 NLP/P60 protein [Paraburkholderia caribensis]